MRMPGLRFTVRRLMLALAVVAALLGALFTMRRQAHIERLLAEHEAKLAALDILTIQRQAHFKRLANLHAERVRGLRSSHGTIKSPNGIYLHVPLVPEAVLEYHMNLAKKYEKAALDPWLPVEPDPPEPKP